MNTRTMTKEPDRQPRYANAAESVNIVRKRLRLVNTRIIKSLILIWGKGRWRASSDPGLSARYAENDSKG